MNSRVSLRQLRAFQAVMIGGSLSAAAARLNLTLPSVSKQLTALESELGIELFNRRRGKVISPTRNGMEFFKSVEATISGLNDLRHIATEIVERGRRRVRIAATPPLINSEPFMTAVEQFLKENGDVHIALESRSRFDIEEWTAMQHIEFALGMLPTSNSELKTLPLVETRAVAVMERDHPLAKKKVLNPDVVRDQSMIMQSRRLLRARIDTVLEQHGYDLPPALESSSAFTCCRMARFGLGIAICDPFSPTSIESQSLVVRAWEPEVKLSYGILMPRNVEIDQSAESLFELIKTHMTLSHTIP